MLKGFNGALATGSGIRNHAPRDSSDRFARVNSRLLENGNKVPVLDRIFR
jgi:hypothetical protein